MKVRIILAAMACMLAFASCDAQNSRPAKAAKPKTETAAASGVRAVKPGESLPAKPAKLTVVDFGADWCGWCHRFEPVFTAAAKKYAGKVVFLTVDTDLCPEIAQKYNVTGLPTQIFIKPDGTVLRNEGYCPSETFDALIDKHLK